MHCEIRHIRRMRQTTRFRTFAVVLLWPSLFCDVTRRLLVLAYRHFGTNYWAKQPTQFSDTYVIHFDISSNDTSVCYSPGLLLGVGHRLFRAAAVQSRNGLDCLLFKDGTEISQNVGTQLPTHAAKIPRRPKTPEKVFINTKYRYI
jgi:hypothetical protein